jgi:hypothetical protein
MLKASNVHYVIWPSRAERLAIEPIPYRNLTAELKDWILDWLQSAQNDVLDLLANPDVCGPNDYLVNGASLEVISPSGISEVMKGRIIEIAKATRDNLRPTALRLRQLPSGDTVGQFLVVPIRNDDGLLLSMREVPGRA